MAIPAYITKTLRLKPEVTKIFDDLDKWLDHCRINLIDFNPADLYRSKEYRDWQRKQSGYERKPYLGKNPRPYNQRSRNDSNAE
jgi:hypothetical protein